MFGWRKTTKGFLMRAMMKGALTAALSFCCLMIMGCQGGAQEGNGSNGKKISQSIKEMQKTLDEMKIELEQMRQHISKASENATYGTIDHLNKTMSKAMEQMKALDLEMTPADQVIMKEVMPLWNSSMNMFQRAIGHMQDAMQMMQIQEGRAREMMHHAVNNMEHSIRSMENSMSVMQKKLERSGAES